MAEARPNPYLQEDAPEQGPPAAPPRENPYLQSEVPVSPHPGILANDPKDGDWTDVGKNIATGAVKGGFGMDTVIDYFTPLGGAKKLAGIGAQIAEKEGYIKPETRDAILDKTNQAGVPGLNAETALRTTGEYVPETAEGRIGQAAVANAVGGIGPGGLGRMAVDAGIGAVSGAVGAGAREVGEATGIKNPIALGALDVAGNLGTAVGLHGVARTAAKVGDEIAQNRYRKTEAGQDAIVGERLRSNLSEGADAEEVAKRLDMPDYVPGSTRVTGEKSGDAGLAELDRELTTRDADYRGNWLERRNANDEARLEYAQGLAKGDPLAVQRTVKQTFDDLDNAAGEIVDSYRTSADDLAAGLGQGRRAEDVGPDMRELLETRHKTAREAASRIYRALEARGRSMEVAPLKQGWAATYRRLTSEDRAGIIPAERTIGKFISGYGDVVPFNRVRSLDKLITDAMATERNANGKSAAWGRLSLLKGSLNDALSSAALSQAERDAQAVARGQLKEQDSLAAILRGLETDIGAEVAAGRSASGAADVAGQARAVDGVGAGDGAAGTAGAGLAAPAPVRYLPAADRKVRPSPPDPPSATFTDTDRADLRRANTGWASQARTFGKGSVGQVLATDGRGDFKLNASAAPSRFFRAGEQGGDAMRQYTEAAGPRGAALAQDYAVERMLNAAADTRNGRIDPKKLASFTKAHRAALDTMPELRDRMTSVENAERLFDDAARARKDAADAHRATLAGKLMGVEDPSEMSRKIGTVLQSAEGPKQMRTLMAEVRKSPEALEGAQKAVIDHMLATSDLKGQSFVNYLKKHRDALAEVLTPEQLQGIERIAADIGAKQRSTGKQTAVPGRSTTAIDLVRDMLTQGASRPMAPAEAADAAVANAPLFVGLNPKAAIGIGAAAGAAAKVQNIIWNFRNAGLDDINRITRQAMLDPKLAAILLREQPPRMTKTWMDHLQRDLANRLTRHAVFAATGDKAERFEPKEKE